VIDKQTIIVNNNAVYIVIIVGYDGFIAMSGWWYRA